MNLQIQWCTTHKSVSAGPEHTDGPNQCFYDALMEEGLVPSEPKTPYGQPATPCEIIDAVVMDLSTSRSLARMAFRIAVIAGELGRYTAGDGHPDSAGIPVQTPDLPEGVDFVVTLPDPFDIQIEGEPV